MLCLQRYRDIVRHYSRLEKFMVDFVVDLESVWLRLLDTYPPTNYENIRHLSDGMSPFLLATPQAKMVLHKTHVIAETWIYCYEDQLVSSIVNRALQVGMCQALSEIDRYCGEESIKFEEVSILHNVTAQSTYRFKNGVSLKGIFDIVESALSRAVGEVGSRFTMGFRPMVVLVREISEDKNVSEQTLEAAEIVRVQERDQDLTWTILALSLVAESGVAEFARGFAIPDRYSFLYGGYGVAMIGDLAKHPISLTVGDFERVDDLLHQISNFSSLEALRLNVALRQFHRAATAADKIQEAIHLRVCLENLFIRDHEDRGIEALLKNRSPLYFNCSKTKVAKIYNFLSRAVHRGELIDTSGVSLHEIKRMISVTIQAYMEIGRYPTWPE